MNKLLFSIILQTIVSFKSGSTCSKDNQCPSNAPCCSQYGYCGSTAEFCSSGCKTEGSFSGKCGASVPPLNGSKGNDSCQPFNIDFANGPGDMFTLDGPGEIKNGNMMMKISQGNTKNPDTGVIMGYGTTMKSKNTIQYGKLNIVMSAGRVPGVVTAFTLLSADKDEIDWEWVGKNEMEAQTNYYSKGALDYTKGAYIPTDFNVHSSQHNYGVEWTQDYINWTIDGKVVRTLSKQSTADGNGGFKFPSSPSNIYFSMWDGGSGAPGTRSWAGDYINWKDAEIVANDGFMNANIKSISYTCM